MLFISPVGQITSASGILGQKGEMPVSKVICSRNFLLFTLFLSYLMIAVVHPCAFGQTTSASVFGRITDQSNAVVTDVEVEIKNTDTGVTQVTKTNGEGF